MSELMLIWWITAVLAGCSLLILAVLAVRRALFEYRAVHDLEVRKLIQAILFRFMLADNAGHQQDLDNLMNFRRREKPLLRKLAIDLFHLIQGHERQRISAVLNRIGFREDCLIDLKKGSPRRRRLAAGALQIFNDDESRTALIQALDDRDPQTRVAAADSLLVIKALPDLDVLLEKLEVSIDGSSRDMRALFRDIARQHPAMLIKVAVHKNLSLKKRLLIADCMAESGSYNVVPILMDYARDQDPELRAAAIRSLTSLQHPAALPVIQDGLRDMHWQVRASAARAAGRIGLTECMSGVNFLVDDRNWWVRFRAAESLFRLGEQGIDILKLRASYTGCGGFGRGARMAALVLDERGIRVLSAELEPEHV